MSATNPRGTRASSRVHLFVAALVVFFVAACSSPPQPAVTSVAVTAPAEIIAGRTAQATVVVEVAHGASDEVVWSSGNEAVATVSAGGLISALSDGNVIITATSLYDATKSHSVTVSVLNPLRDASVLYYRNGLQGTDAALAALTEAADLYGAVVVQTTDANFVADLDAEAPDLVVYLRQNSVAIPDDAEVALLDWVDNGGALVFTSWDITEPDVIAMLAAMDAAPTGNANFASLEVADVAIGAGLADTTMPVVNPDTSWGTYSFGLQETGDGVELAHFYDDTPELTTDAALVSGNDGKTMALGFLVDTVEGADGATLLRNVFEYVLLAALP